MAEPRNIRAFNWLTLELFDQLYESFPEPIDIDDLRFTIDKVLELGSESRETDHLRYLADALKWLREEGFIRYESERGGNFQRVTLTAKGLTVLGYVPASLSWRDRKQPLIDKVRRIVAQGSEDAASDVVKALIVKAVGAAASWK